MLHTLKLHHLLIFIGSALLAFTATCTALGCTPPPAEASGVQACAAVASQDLAGQCWLSTGVAPNASGSGLVLSGTRAEVTLTGPAIVACSQAGAIVEAARAAGVDPAACKDIR